MGEADFAAPVRPPLVAILAVVTAAVLELASARVFPWPAARSFAYSTCAGLALVAVAIAWTRVPVGPQRPISWLRIVGVYPVVAGGVAIGMRGMLRPGSLLVFGVLALLGVLAMAAGAFKRRTTWLAMGALVAGFALRSFELRLVPIDPRRADMVPLVVLALRQFFGGANPYHVYTFPWAVPLTYWPCAWLPYAPAALVGLDIRWTNMVAEASVLGAIVFAARKREDHTYRDLAVMLWAAWFVGHRIVVFDGLTVAGVQWAVLAWTAAFAVELHPRTAAAAGFAVATTPFMFALAPTLGIAFHRAGERPGPALGSIPSARPVLRGCAVAAAVAAVLVLPWLATAPEAFLDGTVRWFNDLDRFPRMKWNESHMWTAQPGLTGVFWTLGLEALLKPLQVVAVCALAFAFARRTAETGPRGAIGGELVAAFTLFLALNPMVWTYLWEPTALLAFVAVASTQVEPATGQ
jgi:hypothetical protein